MFGMTHAALAETAGAFKTLDRETGQVRLTFSACCHDTGEWTDETVALTGRTFRSECVALVVTRLREALSRAAPPEPVTGDAAPSVLAARAVLEHERQARKARLVASQPRRAATGRAAVAEHEPVESAPGVPVLVEIGKGRTLHGAVKGAVLRQARAVRSLRSAEPGAVERLTGAIEHAKLGVLVAERRLAWALHAQGQLGFAGDKRVLQERRDELTRAHAAESAARDAWLAWQLGVTA